MTKIKNIVFYSYVTIMNLLVAIIMLGAIGAADLSDQPIVVRVTLGYLVPLTYFSLATLFAVTPTKPETSRIITAVIHTAVVPFSLMLVPLFQNL